MKKSFVLVVFCLLLSSAASADLAGTLSSGSDQIDGSGVWVDPARLKPSQQSQWFPAAFEWAVSENDDHSWHYLYELEVYKGAVSHLIIETSANFTLSDIFNAGDDYEVGLHRVACGNPGMPEDLYGVKFDDLDGTSVRIEFDSWRRPMWGDFYAKGGKTCGVQNSIWNDGFVDDDPVFRFSDAFPADHVLVPDTFPGAAPVPAPASLALVLAGLPAMVFFGRRRKA